MVGRDAGGAAAERSGTVAEAIRMGGGFRVRVASGSFRRSISNSMPKRRDPAFVIACALAAHASVATSADPLAAIRRCATESDDVQRLACYDRQFRVLDAHAPAASTPAATPTAEQRFGMNGQVESREPAAQAPKIDQLTSRVAALGYKPRGELIIKLENGQVWEEADGEDPVSLKVGAEVIIGTGVMGAYWLQYGKHASVRVKRTR